MKLRSRQGGLYEVTIKTLLESAQYLWAEDKEKLKHVAVNGTLIEMRAAATAIMIKEDPEFEELINKFLAELKGN